MRFSARTVAPAVLLVVTLAAPAGAQVADHLKCYKIKDPVKLAAVVDLDSPQFGLEAGCQVKAGKMFCVPATKTIISAVDKATGLPITPLPVTGPDPGDRICYTVKCPKPFPPDTEATDQFGTRTLTKFRTAMLCVPAVKGGAPPTPTPILTPTPTPTSPPRFVDNGDGTVTDNQTGLQWEEKDGADGGQNLANPHDVDNVYTWSASATAPDGTAFTQFLATLDTPPCFAGHCDWRLPTVGLDGDTAELETIMLQPYPCSTSPCIDPIFGPTVAFCYWSATTDAYHPVFAFGLYFGNSFPDPICYTAKVSYGFYVRAVRSGS